MAKCASKQLASRGPAAAVAFRAPAYPEQRQRPGRSVSPAPLVSTRAAAWSAIFMYQIMYQIMDQSLDESMDPHEEALAPGHSCHDHWRPSAPPSPVA